MTREEAAAEPFAAVIINISHQAVDHPFTYLVPEAMRGLILPGMRVEVPFGRGNTIRQGYVISLSSDCGYPKDQVKEICGIARDGGQREEADAVQLALWMRDRYGSTAITALKTVLPDLKSAKPLERKTVSLTASDRMVHEAIERCEKKHQVARLRLLKSLLEAPEQPWRLLTDKLHVTAATIRSLEKAGLLEIRVEKSLRDPVHEREISGGGPLVLSPEQQSIVDSVLRDERRIREGAEAIYPGFASSGSAVRAVSLLHGITGSGKTEVYIRIIEGIVAEHRQAIFLIPEIALTYQTLLRFYRHFGNRVSVINSSLSAGERADQFERARRGEIDVIIGPRSALFTPFPDPGIIVIDEEHESSYKNESMPKYHARETAIAIARMHRAVVLLGSATPSLESYYLSEQGLVRRYELNRRLTGGTLPQVSVCDLREEMRAGNRSMFSDRLQSMMEDRLARKEQTLLFLNRRGIAGFVSCRSCGHIIKCPHCDVPLSQHRNGQLVCHYCGFTQPMVRTCPECGSPYIAGFRAGTEQVEQLVQEMYPKARILRMDADTTARKGAYEQILSKFANEEADILIGTQMIVKGHDFPKVTLVGILLADLSLGSSDYRAAERTFQLLTQAAGRAGRGERPGEVVIQTYEPENYAIRHAAAQDYRGFYEEEIRYRRMLNYPPVWHMMAVEVQDRDEDAALQMAGDIRLLIDGMNRKEAEKFPQDTVTHPPAASAMADTVVIGPAPARISRIRDCYRYAVYVKDRNYDTLVRYRDRIEETLRDGAARMPRFRNTQVQFDFDPMNQF